LFVFAFSNDPLLCQQLTLIRSLHIWLNNLHFRFLCGGIGYIGLGYESYVNGFHYWNYFCSSNLDALLLREYWIINWSPCKRTSFWVTKRNTFSASSTEKNSTKAKSFYSFIRGSFGILFLTSLISLTEAKG